MNVRVEKHNAFESVFQDFMTDFGGKLIPEAADGYTADYIFPDHSVIAESKCPTVDQTDDMNRKLSPKVEEWARKSGRIPA